MARGACAGVLSAVTALSVLLLAPNGQSTGPYRAAATKHRPLHCHAALIHHGAPPAWTAPAWSGSSPGFTLPYALASDDAAAAFLFANPLRTGHPTNPTNKVLWVVRFPRNGKSLRITARLGTNPSRIVRIRQPADSGPGEIYPSYVDLPRPGCWKLTLTWNAHRANIDIQVRRSATRP